VAVDPSPVWASIKLDHAVQKRGGDDCIEDVGVSRGGNPRTLVLDRRLIKPTTAVVADAFAAACVAGLSLGSSETPSHLMDLPGEKDAPSTCVEMFAGSNLPRFAGAPPGGGGNIQDLCLVWVDPEADPPGLGA